MGLVRNLCVLWSFLILFNFSSGRNYEADHVPATGLADGVSEPRARHRLQLLFPLLLRISTRLATLVPTALMTLMGVIAFVVFSKKALIVSLLALFLTIADKFKNKGEEIYIHKVNSYDDYNDEEHIHYHHGPPYGSYRPHKWKKLSRRTLPVLPPIRPFNPLNSSKRTDWVNQKTSAVLFPGVPDDRESEDWNWLK